MKQFLLAILRKKGKEFPFAQIFDYIVQTVNKHHSFTQRIMQNVLCTRSLNIRHRCERTTEKKILLEGK